jgi:hypothetical protein
VKTVVDSEESTWYAPFLQDLLELMDVLHLRHFAGWEMFASSAISATSPPIFYVIEARPSRDYYAWPVSKEARNTIDNGEMYYVNSAK